MTKVVKVTQNKNPEHLIDDFDDFNEEPSNRYRFLSNFYEGEMLTLHGVTWAAVWDVDAWMKHPGVEALYEWFGWDAVEGYPAPEGPVYFATGEHAFAAMKAWGVDVEQFIEIVVADGPGPAKSLGRTCDLRDDWEVVKLDVMAAVVRSKFTLEREEGRRLLYTGDALLIEGTWWRDDVWGVHLTKSNTSQTASGRNWLGTLLMARRAELRAEQNYSVTCRAVVANAKTAVKGWQRPAWMSRRK